MEMSLATAPLNAFHFLESLSPGTLIAASYVLAGLLCVWALHAARAGAERAKQHRLEERRKSDRRAAYRARTGFWITVVALFAVLAYDSRFNAHGWLTEVGRALALDQGWYLNRRPVQGWVVLGLFAGGVLALAMMLSLARRHIPRQAPAIAALVLLGSFVLMRVLSFHPLDDFLAQELMGLRLQWWVELSAIACVCLCAIQTSWWHVRKKEREGLKRDARAEGAG